MIRLRHCYLSAIGLIVLASCQAFANEPLFQTDFETDPAASGWLAVDAPDGAFEGKWQDRDAPEEGYCIALTSGRWQSPAFPVKPLQYYKVRFHYTAERQSMWAAHFFDAGGVTNDSDHCGGLDAAEEWTVAEFCFRGRLTTAHARIGFAFADGRTLCVDDIRVTAVSRKDVAQWADGVYATMPPVGYAPPAGRWKGLPRTAEKLRKGKRLRIVMLGDSIINDTANSGFDALLGRMYPGARVELITSVRAATGCRWYRRRNRVKRYVIDHNPDLVIIGGISHNQDAESVRSVVQQIRAEIDPEIIVMTGAIADWDLILENRVRWEGLPRARALAEMEAYAPALEKMARQEGVPYIPMRVVWDDYVKAAGKPFIWYHRDETHANVRGKQAVARMLLAWFAPED